MRLLLAFLLLVSCVPTKYLRISPCVNLIKSEFPIPQSAIDFDFDLAREILDRRHILPREKFCPVFSGVSIHVRTDYSWYANTSRGPVVAVGAYLQNKIELNNTGSALLHELLHHLEAGISTDHDHWWEKGYYAADLEFGTLYQAFNSPPSGPTGN